MGTRAPPSRLGRLVEWHDARGYGFIVPLDPAADVQRVFVHLSAFPRDVGRPAVGQTLRYVAERQDDGRWRAARVESLARATATGGPRRTGAGRAQRSGFGAAAAAIALHVALVAWGVTHGRLPTLAMAVLGALDLIAFGAYAADKAAAQAGRRRIPEAHLHLLELSGGWPGALVARRLLRHKSAKRAYGVVLWTIVVLHLGATLWFVFR